MNEAFERENLCYEENCENLLRLNQIIWRVAMVAMTLIGGEWYGVATLGNGHKIRIAGFRHGRRYPFDLKVRDDTCEPKSYVDLLLGTKEIHLTPGCAIGGIPEKPTTNEEIGY